MTKNKTVARSTNHAHGEEYGFSQVNTGQNMQMQNYILDLLGKPHPRTNTLLDLYCGNGNFSIPLMASGWDVFGIDGNSSAILHARKEGLRTFPAGKAYFSCDDCANGVRKLVYKRRSFQTIILDPPRIGADEKVLKQITKLNATNLIYISCNPATFARDWARIKIQNDYRLMSVQPYDMFPQTFHVELIAFAQKSS